ncbi:unnamed protein product [Brassica oleracea]
MRNHAPSGAGGRKLYPSSTGFKFHFESVRMVVVILSSVWQL